MRFEPARGPGGQNVNKVSTRAVLLFDFEACTLLSDPQRARIAGRYAARLARDGRLRIVAEQARTQVGNRALAERRLLELLASALHVPTPRRATRPTAGSQRRRVQTKRRHGELKQQRRRTCGEE